jgi:hypothetical protein
MDNMRAGLIPRSVKKISLHANFARRIKVKLAVIAHMNDV